MSGLRLLSDDTRQKLAGSGAANISNCLLKRGLRNTFLLGLQPLAATQEVLVGPAFTLRFIPAREDIDSMALYQRDDSLHRRAIEECPERAVLVMSTGGDTRVSCMGDMMALRLRTRGVAGVVTDGGYRDSPGIRATGLPCFQRESSGPATPITLHPVEFNTPVGCAGVPVYPGDIMVGDAEGVVAIPAHLADEIAEETVEMTAYEDFVTEQVLNGATIIGLYPATSDAPKIKFAEWRKKNGR